MSEWSSLFNGNCPSDPFRPDQCPRAPAQFRPPTQARQFQPPTMDPSPSGVPQPKSTPKGENPRELRNRAEKQRRDILNQSVSRLATIVPPVATSSKKVDKTSVLRYTAHYLRAHKHVFGKSIHRGPEFSAGFTRSFLETMKGFVLTCTYKGLVVVVSPNIQEYLGYTEVELLGQSLYSIVHLEDHLLLKEQLFPRCCKLTSNGELLLSQEHNAAQKAAEALKNEKRAFMIRFKKLTHLRSEAAQYITCHVEGSFRKSDDAGVYVDNNVQTGRRVRSRGNNPYASGNDIVFVSVIRPITETFRTESRLEAFRMEYRTRHSIDGSIIQCEHRISLVTGYMLHEVNGVNAMNFMHREDMRWVVVALREMYVNHRLMGESCYRLMTKNGQFIHMRTRGALEVDPVSNEASSFVCTNTVVPEEEGFELIKQMKEKFSLKINNGDPMNDLTDTPQGNENQSIPVEDPRQLEQVIYRLVTDLPSPRPEDNTPKKSNASSQDLSIIPPNREQIKLAIAKSCSVLKTLQHSNSKTENMSKEQSPAGSVQNSSNANPTISENSEISPGNMDQQNNLTFNGETYAPDYSWIHAPSTSNDLPENEDRNVNHYGHASYGFDNAVANCSHDPDPGCDEYGTSSIQQAIFNSLNLQSYTAEFAYEKQSVIEDEAVKEETKSLQSRSSTTSLQMNVPPNDWNSNDDSEIDNNSLANAASFREMFDTAQAESNIENGWGAWTNSGAQLFGQIPEASTSAYMETENFTYLNIDSSVTSNTQNFEPPSSMDHIIPDTLQLDDDRLMLAAEQASRVLNASTIDDIVRAAEMEYFDMEYNQDRSEEINIFMYENSVLFAVSSVVNNDINDDHIAGNSNINDQDSPLVPVFNENNIANNNNDPFEFEEDTEPI